MTLWNNVPDGFENITLTAPEFAEAVPAWYARRAIVESIKFTSPVLDFAGCPVSYKVGDSILVVGLDDQDQFTTAVAHAKLVEAKEGRKFKVTLKTGETMPTGKVMFIKTFARKCETPHAIECFVPVTVDEILADREGTGTLANHGMVSPGWYRHKVYTTEGGVTRITSELLVSIRTMGEIDATDESITRMLQLDANDAFGVIGRDVLS